MEYEVYLLDEKCELDTKGEVILATNNLAIACWYCYDYYKKFKIPIGVWQPRHEIFREHYAPWLSDYDPNDNFIRRVFARLFDFG